MIDRDAVRDNAKYLRNVRPIDPDEIAEYIEGGPHPGIVRQILREEAASLGLVERDDRRERPVIALGLVGLLWVAVPGSVDTLAGATGLYLVGIAVLTLPHTAVVLWLDREQRVWP